MAVVDRKSQVITDLDATPRVASDSYEHGGNLQAYVGSITPATDDSANSIGRLVRVPSTIRVTKLTLSAADFTSAGVANIGVYYAVGHAASPLGGVIDADYFASLLDFAASTGMGVTDGTSVINESTTNTLTKQTQPLWQALGLSADPGGWFDIAYTITTAFDGGQQILCRCEGAI